MDQRISNDDWMDARIRLAERDSDEAHAECFTEMFKGIAAVAAKNLKAYGLGVPDRDVTGWLGSVHDDLMDNLLWQEWGGASDCLPSDRDAWIERIWREAKERA